MQRAINGGGLGNRRVDLDPARPRSGRRGDATSRRVDAYTTRIPRYLYVAGPSAGARGADVTFVLSKPDVFKTSHSETYVIFGEVKFDDVNYHLQTQVAEQFKAPGLSSMNSKGEPSMAAVQDDEEVDETGVDKKDIELVMMQASVSRSSAVEALKAADGDIVSAIMELTN
ncbi:hypothetical protein ZWY2020_026989 [Hordeum vulgare]|nr:hypothetical protein ZWY2020_026989 [Hordeum vulgare]